MPERQIALTSKLKPWIRPVWRRTLLFYVTILATLCMKELRAAQYDMIRQEMFSVFCGDDG